MSLGEQLGRLLIHEQVSEDEANNNFTNKSWKKFIKTLIFS